MRAQSRFFGVLCFIVLATLTIYNSTRAIVRTSSTSKLGTLCSVGSPQFHVIEKIKNNKYDTAPFNRSTLTPPFFRYRANMQVASKYHLSTCIIEKVMSTTVDAIFCYLTNTTEFISNQRSISTEEHTSRFCGFQNRHLIYDELDDIVGKSRVQFVTVRHPMQRFLSGYVDKCIREAEEIKKQCFKCSDNLTCFIEKLYSYLNEVHANDKALIGYNYDLAHFAPQNWYCNFYNHFDDYTIIRQGENREEIMEHAHKLEMILLSANVPDQYRKEINRQLLIGSSPHKTSGSMRRSKLEQTLLKNKTLLTLFTKIYYYDFVLFGFSLPITI